jgi:simple sugar transport system substrate-binding protein
MKEESMRRMATLAVAGVAAISAVVRPSVSYAADQLRFVMVSHIGSNDPNMGWLTTSLKAFEQKYPDVKTE